MKCPSPISIKDKSKNHASHRVTVPCGRCGACRHNRRSSWSFRLAQELKISRSTHFITLTYSDETLPHNREGVITLRKKDLQLFLKRLRFNQAKYTDTKIRHYAVGEYGTNTQRPHYHALIFNLHHPQLIDNSWPHGHTHIGTVTPASIHYVAKFHVNKSSPGEDREPEFAIMSTRPGIGSNYIDNVGTWHRENEYTHIINNGYKQAMPKYYKDKIFPEWQRKNLAEKAIIKTDQDYYTETKRLEDLQIKNTDRYIHSSQLREAQKIRDKAKKDQLF